MSEIETLQQRLAKAERLLDNIKNESRLKHLASGDWWIRQIDYLLNRKGEDMTDMNGGGGKTVSVSDGVVKLSVGCQQCAEKDNRIAELERLYKAAMKSAEDRLQAASAAEERAERLQDNCDGLQRKQMELEEELATMKSVRVLSGDDLRNLWGDVVSDCGWWREFAERLQLRCACPPMTGAELLDFCSSHWISGEEKSGWHALADHIWPKAEPKPTREEVAGRIVVAFKNDRLSDITLHPLKTHRVGQSAKKGEPR